MCFQKKIDIIQQIRPAGVKQSRSDRTVETGFEQHYPQKRLVLEQKRAALWLRYRAIHTSAAISSGVRVK